MYVSRNGEWIALEILCQKLESFETDPSNTIVVTVSPDYSATVGMHVAHHLSKNGEMLPIKYIEVPYPDEDVEIYKQKFLDSSSENSIHTYKDKKVILVEAGVISGKNYQWITNYLKEAGIKYITAALYENVFSTYKSDAVGEYYNHNIRELEFYWERHNNHWK